jgi:hypothetical protein
MEETLKRFTKWFHGAEVFARHSDTQRVRHAGMGASAFDLY